MAKQPVQQALIQPGKFLPGERVHYSRWNGEVLLAVVERYAGVKVSWGGFDTYSIRPVALPGKKERARLVTCVTLERVQVFAVHG